MRVEAELASRLVGAFTAGIARRAADCSSATSSVATASSIAPPAGCADQAAERRAEARSARGVEQLGGLPRGLGVEDHCLAARAVRRERCAFRVLEDVEVGAVAQQHPVHGRPFWRNWTPIRIGRATPRSLIDRGFGEGKRKQLRPGSRWARQRELRFAAAIRSYFWRRR
ncbi:hypothetical protein LJR290_003418 [Variovorax sp. LjRoot290]|uniref:hypothetical protein n=1 Tax=Variovorax sp. LjRoot290 TaxID=3342316 RepID=UPI003ED09347